MDKEEISFFAFVITLFFGWILGVLVMQNILPKQTIEQYQLCLEAGATVEYCESNY